ncbi:hypothetical protein N0V94_009177 [Neodidymelliopsis sp. IMI 364377]|nr:hypothetical protein N0V94_009177 [Neodidymelliopsis sp. IMI 364377]
MQQAVLNDPNTKTITSQLDSQTNNKQTIASTTPCSTVSEAETMSNPVPTPSSKAIAPRKRPRLNRTESYISELQLETQKTTSPLLDQAETQFQQLMTTLQQHKTESEAAFARSKVEVEVDGKVKAATIALEEERKKRVAAEKLVMKQVLEIANLKVERNTWEGKFENKEEECGNLKGKLQELKKRVRGLVDEE